MSKNPSIKINVGLIHDAHFEYSKNNPESYLVDFELDCGLLFLSSTHDDFFYLVTNREDFLFACFKYGFKFDQVSEGKGNEIYFNRQVFNMES